jgi:hypothetical protein
MDARKTVQQETDFLNRTVTVSGTTYIESQEVMVKAHNSWDNVAIRATLG